MPGRTLSPENYPGSYRKRSGKGWVQGSSLRVRSGTFWILNILGVGTLTENSTHFSNQSPWSGGKLISLLRARLMRAETER